MPTKSDARQGSIRVIGGRLKGSVLDVPASAGLRPTPNRIRETLFNWLAPYIDGARCLDIYAGTGALALEALSRGAGAALALERDARLADALIANGRRLGVPNLTVLHADGLAHLEGPPTPFDLVFVDPPFDTGLWQRTAALLDRGWLAPGALVHVEAPHDRWPALPASWLVHRESRAGAVRHALLRPASATSG